MNIKSDWLPQTEISFVEVDPSLSFDGSIAWNEDGNSIAFMPREQYEERLDELSKQSQIRLQIMFSGKIARFASRLIANGEDKFPALQETLERAIKAQVENLDKKLLEDAYRAEY